MKKYTVWSLILMICISSCEDSDPQPIRMTATVDGNEWSSSNVTATIGQGRIEVIGKNSGQEIGFTIFFGTAEGTYDVDGDYLFSGCTVFYSSGSGDNHYTGDYNEKVGEVTITEINADKKTISGTFSTKVKRLIPAEEEIVITGTFTEVKYEDNFGTIADPTLVEFQCKINGVDFKAVGTTHQTSGLYKIFRFSNGIQTMEFAFYSPTTGVHTLGPIDSNYFVAYYDGINTYVSTVGEVNITNMLPPSMDGEYSFTAEMFPFGGNSIEITNGSFSVPN